MIDIKPGQLWVTNSTNGECGMIVVEVLKKGKVRFRGVGKHIGVEVFESTTREAYIHSSFSLATVKPVWLPKIPDHVFLDDFKVPMDGEKMVF